ncbi:hypothetical protein AQ883_16115 [Burkholderia pseudomallei]|nr:hypothetical protein AQ863_15470 [Burkholderia pseudomallei]OMZ51843.1 hypothetical protein AQ864_28735 [Burkholderia pseudomallei]OMZ67664.1 hypothetical protein AQ867_07165 [Burkholderia pseudomallei]OMZ72053.1 hypothetical protein AQ866_22420 [Burkholderia pseudomallei]OMZ80155.1 hypothetical protein AQ868_10310 [Burkholderia pseudomallei]
MRIVSALGRRPLSLHAARERPRPCIEGPAPRGASMLARVAPFCPTTAGPARSALDRAPKHRHNGPLAFMLVSRACARLAHADTTRIAA